MMSRGGGEVRVEEGLMKRSVVVVVVENLKCISWTD